MPVCICAGLVMHDKKIKLDGVSFLGCLISTLLTSEESQFSAVPWLWILLTRGRWRLG